MEDNIEITRIPNSISDNNLESTVINVLSEVQCTTNAYVTVDDIEVCHRIGKSLDRKSLACFINRKHCKFALVNRKKQKSLISDSIGLPNVKSFFNENLTEYNNILVFC